MIGNLTFEELENLILTLNNANNSIKVVAKEYQSDEKINTVKIERFSSEIDRYTEYLQNLLQVNQDVEEAIKKLKDMNN